MFQKQCGRLDGDPDALTDADRQLTVTLNLPSPMVATVLFKAFQPEVVASRGSGSSVHMTVTENLLTLRFSTRSTATLRALINSYLRWVIMISEVDTVLHTPTST